ncbi:hypothetical protein [Methanobacterium sp.]|uniref:hypothetical protein n=1 Tax=Methanobacterium sp. TaxID=2164 RepID=UPI003C744D17
MDLKRITVISGLILILLCLCFYYYSYHGSNLKYPSTAAIESNYPEGSLVFVSGTVIKQNNNGFYLLDGNNWSIIYKVVSGKHVEVDDNVQLLGILGPSYTIKSTRTVVETNWGYEFIIFRSALALIVLLFIFFRYWKFDFKTFELIRRD